MSTTSSHQSDSLLPERKVLLDFFADGRAVRDDVAISANAGSNRRLLLSVFHALIAEGVIVESRKHLASGKLSSRYLFHLKPELLTPEALARLQRLVALAAPAVRS